jgi:zinc-ribbon domain
MNCRVCGTKLPEGAMFCGECGSSVTSSRVPRAAVQDPRPSDTSIVQPLVGFSRPGPARPGPEFPPEHRTPIPSVGSPEASRVPEESPVPEEPHGTVQFEAPAEPPLTVAPDAPVYVETDPPVTFIFDLSSGSSVIVRGSGLLGRRPSAQPGESFDQLITFIDPERSVSKTHLEFGIEGLELWVSDRYSANGTIIRPRSGQARLLDPGHRYRVDRGTRVDVGDQHFDVS